MHFFYMYHNWVIAWFQFVKLLSNEHHFSTPLKSDRVREVLDTWNVTANSYNSRASVARTGYRKNSKIWDTSNNCHNCPKNRKV